MQLEITQADVELADFALGQGLARSCHCPMAQALKRMFPDKLVVTTRSFSDVGNTRYSHPMDLYDAIVQWDAGGIFKVGVYTLTRG